MRNRLTIAPPPHGDLPNGSARNLDDTKSGVALLVGDIGDVSPIRRPASSRRVAFTVGQLQRVATIRSHQPELMPLAAQVRAVHHSLAVAAPVGPSLPRGLLIPKLPRLRA